MSVSNHVSDIMNKIDHAKLSGESKQIFSLLLSYFDCILKEKDSQVNDLKDRVFFLEQRDLFVIDQYSMEKSIDNVNQYERKDALIVSGPSIPNVSVGEDC